jgi:hypothetical protein
MNFHYFSDIAYTPELNARILAIETMGLSYHLQEQSPGEWDIYVPIHREISTPYYVNLGWTNTDQVGGKYNHPLSFAIPFIDAIKVMLELKQIYCNLETKIIAKEYLGVKAENVFILPDTDEEILMLILSLA